MAALSTLASHYYYHNNYCVNIYLLLTAVVAAAVVVFDGGAYVQQYANAILIPNTMIKDSLIDTEKPMIGVGFIII
jgi:hypothetical protein